MVLLATLLLFPLALQEPAAWEAALARAAGNAPAATLAEADALGADAEDDDFAAARARLADAQGAELLFLVRFLSYGADDPELERLVPLVDPAQPELALAALSTLATAGGEEAAKAQRALGARLLELEPAQSPEVWCEGQLTLFRIGDGVYRAAALRVLRSQLAVEDGALRRRAALAVGRTGVVLDAAERQVLAEIAQGVGADAALAGTLLDRIADQERHRQKEEALLLYTQKLQEQTGQPSQGALGALEDVLRMAESAHMEGERFSREELLEAAADGMLRRLDPYSDFMSSADVQDFKFEMDPQYGGIGAYVNIINGVFTIVRPMYSGPAYRAGLLSNDKVFEVDGWSTAEQPQDEVIRRLKGKPGTSVVLKVWRPGWNEPREIPVEREQIEVPVLEQEMLPGRVLYLELISFGAEAAPQIADAVRAAQAEGALSGVVLDLRNNPGGYLEAAVEIADVFLPRDKLVVTTKSRTQPEERHYTRKPALVDESVPLVLLVNDLSASASEIVAGALGQHGRAVLIGERTVGKGSVQQLLRIPGQPGDEPWNDANRNRMKDEWETYTDVNGNEKHDYAPLLKLTIAYYYLPDGSSIHTLRDHDGRVTQPGGIEPDRVVTIPQLDYPTLRELDRLLGEDVFREYAQRIMDQDPTVAVRIAEFDDRDLGLYPGWEEFYAALGTTLDPQEVRRWVRRSVRALVSDARQKVFPGNGFLGDFQEDPQLQEGIRLLLEKSGHGTEDFPQYRLLARAPAAPGVPVADGER
jgi:C-terminal peptidase prc